MRASAKEEPDSGTDLRLSQVTRAREVIPRCFLDTPQYEDDLLNAALGRRVTVKVETQNPIRSFKGRGVGFALSGISTQESVVCASSGNFGQAVAYVGRSRGLQVEVYAPAPVNSAKRERMAAFGARVIDVRGDMGDAQRAAASAAEDAGAHLIVDGVPPAIAEGAATIAEELTRTGTFDTLVAPIGDGSLISGLALWLRAHAPGTRIVGVNPATAPAMHQSMHAGEPITVTPTSTFPEGITISRPHPESLIRVRALVDDIVLVEEDDLGDAMDLIATRLSLLAEPAGAAGIAAIATGKVDGDAIATLVTGANPDPGATPSVPGPAGEEVPG